MLSLYFNCRIANTRLTPDVVDSPYFYPVVYPNLSGWQKYDPYRVLLETLESYAQIEYNVAVINILVDGLSDYACKELVGQLKETMKANKLEIHLNRPSNKTEWLEDAHRLEQLVEENEPILVVMNHDHPFVDYSVTPLLELVEKVFLPHESNHGKALYYSHAPEVISWAINGHGSIRYKEIEPGLYKSTKVNKWIDSICIMTIRTLVSVWEKLETKESYLGRFDWVGVEFNNLSMTTYTCMRELFKHYDGYSHITGIRLISQIDEKSLMPIERTLFQSKDIDIDIDNLTRFYFQKWIDTQIIMIRDSLRKRRNILTSVKKAYVAAIEKSLTLFKIGYLDNDVKNGLITIELAVKIDYGMRNLIYHEGNSIFNQITVDNYLLSTSIKEKIASLCSRKITKLLSVYNNSCQKAINAKKVDG